MYLEVVFLFLNVIQEFMLKIIIFFKVMELGNFFACR